MNLHKFLFITGSRFRNPSLWKYYNQLKESESWSLDKLKSQQQERLIRFLEHAGTYSPYYNKVFKKLGWSEGKSFSMELFQKIPEITKETLLSENDSIHTTTKYPKLFFCETSGTSGQVLTFRRDEPWDSFNRASILRGYSWYDVKGWDFNLYFWGYNFSLVKKVKLRIMDYLVNRYRMFGYSEQSLKMLSRKIPKAIYIEGYSSMIYELACAAEGLKLDLSRIKMVKGTSEKIYPHYHEQTRKVFGKRMISEYGSAESGIIAFECPQGSMHINMEGVYVETDHEGEILVTNFHSYSFPVIRYRLGDAIKLNQDNKKCPCGMSHPIIEEVTGRIGKLIIGKLHRYPSLTFYYIFKNLYFEHNLNLNYQAHQNEPGIIEIWIKEQIGQVESQLVMKESEKYFKDDIKVVLRHGGNFRLQSGKLRDFVTTLN